MQEDVCLAALKMKNLNVFSWRHFYQAHPFSDKPASKKLSRGGANRGSNKWLFDVRLNGRFVIEEVRSMLKYNTIITGLRQGDNG